jgi:ribosomal-protein-alanine N-acetyltransferase
VRAAPELHVRPARSGDRADVATLLSQAHWRHFHLDWRDPLDLLDHPPNLLGFQGGRLEAQLSAPPEVPGCAWVRSFCVAPGLAPLPAWRVLWAEAAAVALGMGIPLVGCLLSGEWMRPLLSAAGFREMNSVVFFEWRYQPLPRESVLADRIRPMSGDDLPRVCEVDGRAFPPLWRNGADGLAAALQQAVVATCLELEDEVVGYQITTASPFGAHLARLAVDPDVQGRGFGAALVVDLLHQLHRRGFDAVTLNTQADNRRSQELYRKLGFRETGQRYPTFEISLA